MSSIHPDLQPFEPQAFAPRHAAHLLGRATFGGTPREIEQAIQWGPAQTVDHLLDFPDSRALDQDASDIPDLSGLREFPTTFVELEKRFAGVGEREARILRGVMIDANRAALLNVLGWWLKRMAFGKHPLQEKLALFWHGHFTTSSYDVWSTRMIWEQNELLRRHAAEAFGPFLTAICRDPAMLIYLDNATSKRQSPNENFARELVELFTLGIGHYTEDDVRSISRAFTGWSHDGERFIFAADDHDYDEKVVFGKKGRFDGGDVLELLLAHPQLPKFISRKLFEYFVGSPIDADVQQSLADVFSESQFDIRQLVRTILCSRAFYDERAIGTQIKSPVHLLVGTIRLLDAPMLDIKQIKEHLLAMGQLPFLPPDVKGWPSGRDWINTTRLFSRQNAAVWLGGMIAADAPAASWRDTVDRWLSRLIAQPISKAKRQVLIDLPAKRGGASIAQRELAELILSMPEYQMT